MASASRIDHSLSDVAMHRLKDQRNAFAHDATQRSAVLTVQRGIVKLGDTIAHPSQHFHIRPASKSRSRSRGSTGARSRGATRSSSRPQSHRFSALMLEKQQHIRAHEEKCRRKARHQWGVVRSHLREIAQAGRDARAKGMQARTQSGAAELLGHLVVEPRQTAPEVARRVRALVRHCCVDIMPVHSGFRGSWDIAMMVALLWIMITLPYRVAFEVELSPSHGAYWFERFIDLFFIAARPHNDPAVPSPSTFHLSGSSRCPDSHVHFPHLSCRTLR